MPTPRTQVAGTPVSVSLLQVKTAWAAHFRKEPPGDKPYQQMARDLEAAVGPGRAAAACLEVPNDADLAEVWLQKAYEAALAAGESLPAPSPRGGQSDWGFVKVRPATGRRAGWNRYEVINHIPSLPSGVLADGTRDPDGCRIVLYCGSKAACLSYAAWHVMGSPGAFVLAPTSKRSGQRVDPGRDSEDPDEP